MDAGKLVRKKIGLAFECVIEELLYGGAKGGGKSVLGCIWVYTYAKWLIKTFKLEPREYPIVVGFMGRKQSVDFTGTTLNTWKRIIPPDAYTLLEGKKQIIIEDTVAIQYGGFDDRDTIKKFNSAEYCFYFVDQAEELTEQEIGLLRGTLRLKLPMEVKGVMEEVSPPFKGLLTANPAICWLKPAFIKHPQPRTQFIQALPTDNPFLDENYIPRLRKAFGFSPQLLRAYLEGSWDDLDVAFVVIHEKDIDRCVGNRLREKNNKRVTVADISEGGQAEQREGKESQADETVIYDFQDYNVVEESMEIYNHRDPMDTVGRVIAHAVKNKSNLICIDKVGVGATVYWNLQKTYGSDERMEVYGFDSREKPPTELDQKTYYNFRSWAWFQAAERIREKKCCVPDDEILKEQLASARFSFRNGKILVNPKDEQKELTGSSPDRADTFVMGIVALKRATPVKKRDAYAMPDTKDGKHWDKEVGDYEDFSPDAL